MFRLFNNTKIDIRTRNGKVKGGITENNDQSQIEFSIVTVSPAKSRNANVKIVISFFRVY